MGKIGLSEASSQARLVTSEFPSFAVSSLFEEGTPSRDDDEELNSIALTYQIYPHIKTHTSRERERDKQVKSEECRKLKRRTEREEYRGRLCSKSDFGNGRVREELRVRDVEKEVEFVGTAVVEWSDGK
jgi:hypothetical protein